MHGNSRHGSFSGDPHLGCQWQSACWTAIPGGACGQSVDESYDVWCMRMRNCLFAEEATEIDIT